MKKTVFRGVGTAIVTPMNANGVDYDAFERLIEWQIAEGVNALVVAGTTGEGSTLTDDEHKEVLRFSVEKVNGRVPIVAGTGSNDTAYAIALTKYACEIGCDAMLLVTPYYNKATQRGLIESFRAIADASTKPCILYNVPSRTGCNLTPASCAILAEHPNIVGIKEASGNISQVAEIAALTKGEFDIYSGNDDQIVPMMSLGAQGVISVLSNILPNETHQMCYEYFEGNCQKAMEMQIRYSGLIEALFCDVNPTPVKQAMNLIGMEVGPCRLPLYPMNNSNLQFLKDKLLECGFNF